MYERILIPIDGSECSENALGEALRLAKMFGGKVMLFARRRKSSDVYLRRIRLRLTTRPQKTGRRSFKTRQNPL